MNTVVNTGSPSVALYVPKATQTLIKASLGEHTQGISTRTCQTHGLAIGSNPHRCPISLLHHGTPHQWQITSDYRSNHCSCEMATQ